MTAPALPAGVTGKVEMLSFCPRERRMVSRHRVHLDHARAVLAARPRFLHLHEGRIPAWPVPSGLRTVKL